MTRSSRWQSTARWGRAAARAFLLSIVLGTAFGGGAAKAGTDSLCNGCWVGANSYFPGPQHTLTGVKGTTSPNTLWGCGGAVNYGSYFCGIPSGCHSYNGNGGVQTPAIRHRNSQARQMEGVSTWGSTGPPSNCTYSYVLSASADGPVEAKDPDGIAVLERSAVRGPEDLADVFPGADLSRVRSFETPRGQAFVVVDPGARLVCVAVDDEGTGYGYGCRRFGEVQSSGILATLEDDDASTGKGDVVIAIAPDGVEELVVDRADGSERRVPVVQGAAVARLSGKDEKVTLPKSEDAPQGVKAQRFVVAG